MYSSVDFPKKFVMLWKFHQFARCRPGMFGAKTFPIVWRYYYHKRQIHEKAIRKMLERLTSSELRQSDIDIEAYMKDSVVFEENHKEGNYSKMIEEGAVNNLKLNLIRILAVEPFKLLTGEKLHSALKMVIKKRQRDKGTPASALQAILGTRKDSNVKNSYQIIYENAEELRIALEGRFDQVAYPSFVQESPQAAFKDRRASNLSRDGKGLMQVHMQQYLQSGKLRKEAPSIIQSSTNPPGDLSGFFRRANKDEASMSYIARKHSLSGFPIENGPVVKTSEMNATNHLKKLGPFDPSHNTNPVLDARPRSKPNLNVVVKTSMENSSFPLEERINVLGLPPQCPGIRNSRISGNRAGLKAKEFPIPGQIEPTLANKVPGDYIHLAKDNRQIDSVENNIVPDLKENLTAGLELLSKRAGCSKESTRVYGSKQSKYSGLHTTEDDKLHNMLYFNNHILSKSRDGLTATCATAATANPSIICPATSAFNPVSPSNPGPIQYNGVNSHSDLRHKQSRSTKHLKITVPEHDKFDLQTLRSAQLSLRGKTPLEAKKQPQTTQLSLTQRAPSSKKRLDVTEVEKFMRQQVATPANAAALKSVTRERRGDSAKSVHESKRRIAGLGDSKEKKSVSKERGQGFFLPKSYGVASKKGNLAGSTLNSKHASKEKCVRAKMGQTNSQIILVGQSHGDSKIKSNGVIDASSFVNQTNGTSSLMNTRKLYETADKMSTEVECRKKSKNLALISLAANPLSGGNHLKHSSSTQRLAGLGSTEHPPSHQFSTSIV